MKLSDLIAGCFISIWTREVFNDIKRKENIMKEIILTYPYLSFLSFVFVVGLIAQIVWKLIG